MPKALQRLAPGRAAHPGTSEKKDVCDPNGVAETDYRAESSAPARTRRPVRFALLLSLFGVGLVEPVDWKSCDVRFR